MNRGAAMVASIKFGINMALISGENTKTPRITAVLLSLSAMRGGVHSLHTKKICQHDVTHVWSLMVASED
jgi:hypothetical protein